MNTDENTSECEHYLDENVKEFERNVLNMRKLTQHLVLLILLTFNFEILHAQEFKIVTISWEKPEFLVFGSDINELKAILIDKGYQVTERNITPIELPTARESQIQLDVEGIIFGGKERFVELIFADGILDMMWILTEAEEEEFIKTRMQKDFGEPSHIVPGAWFYIDQKTALRTEPHEVLFISDRLVEPYRQWLESMRRN